MNRPCKIKIKRPPRLDCLEAGRVGLASWREWIIPVGVAFPDLAATAMDLELRLLPNGHVTTTDNGIRLLGSHHGCSIRPRRADGPILAMRNNMYGFHTYLR